MALPYTLVGAEWILVHGWSDWNSAGTREPEPMLFQARHICGVYPKTMNGHALTSLLFVNCEHMIQETLDTVIALLGIREPLP